MKVSFVKTRWTMERQPSPASRRSCYPITPSDSTVPAGLVAAPRGTLPRASSTPIQMLSNPSNVVRKPGTHRGIGESAILACGPSTLPQSRSRQGRQERARAFLPLPPLPACPCDGPAEEGRRRVSTWLTPSRTCRPEQALSVLRLLGHLTMLWSLEYIPPRCPVRGS